MAPQAPYTEGWESMKSTSQPDCQKPCPTGLKATPLQALADVDPDDFCTIITGFECNEIGETILTALIFDPAQCKWNCMQKTCNKAIYGPGDKLPPFHGTVEVCLEDGSLETIEGDCETLPENVAGCLEFVGKDELGKVKPVFKAGKVNLPEIILAEVPELIRIGGDKPDPDGTVQLHIDAEGHQLYNNGDTFVSVTPTK